MTGCSGDGGASESSELPAESDLVSTSVELCEFSWTGSAWKFKAGIAIKSMDANSHSVDLGWEVTDSGGVNIYGSADYYDIRVNPSKGVLFVDDTYPEDGIDINADNFDVVQDNNGFVCRVTFVSAH